MIIVIGVAASVVTTIAVMLRRRPPSLSALAWLATYLFALIQVRAEFPGEPPIGLAIDRFLTFPAIAVVMGLIVVNAFMWFRNKSTQTSSQRRLFADDGSTAVATEAVSDDGTTYTKGEAS
jgi:hypothetical protein